MIMKSSSTALFIFSALWIVGSVMADEEGGEPLNTSPPLCPLTVTEGDHPMMAQLMKRTGECVWNPKIKFPTDISRDTEEYRKFVNSFCGELPTASSCLQETNAVSQICLEEEFRPIVRIQGVFFMDLAETSCRDGGVRLAAVLERLKTMENLSISENVYERCRIASYKTLASTVDNANVDNEDKPMIFSLENYLIVKNLKKCLVESNLGETDGVDNAISLLADVVKSVHCIEKNNPNDVLCEAIDRN